MDLALALDSAKETALDSGQAMEQATDLGQEQARVRPLFISFVEVFQGCSSLGTRTRGIHDDQADLSAALQEGAGDRVGIEGCREGPGGNADDPVEGVALLVLIGTAMVQGCKRRCDGRRRHFLDQRIELGLQGQLRLPATSTKGGSLDVSNRQSRLGSSDRSLFAAKITPLFCADRSHPLPGSGPDTIMLLISSQHLRRSSARISDSFAATDAAWWGCSGRTTVSVHPSLPPAHSGVLRSAQAPSNCHARSIRSFIPAPSTRRTNPTTPQTATWSPISPSNPCPLFGHR